MKNNVAIAVLLAIFFGGVQGGAQGRRTLARVTDAFGTARRQTGAPTAPWQEISVGDLLLPQTSVKTGANSAVLIALPGGHVLRVGSDTTVQLRELGVNKSYSFVVLSGKIWSVVRAVNKPTKYEVETPSAVAGVEGTLFAVIHDQASEETVVSTNQGTVNLRQGGRTVKVTQGLTARVKRNQKELPVASQTPAGVQSMWQTIRKETWITRSSSGSEPMRLNHDAEERINDSVGQHPQQKKEKTRKVPPKRRPR